MCNRRGFTLIEMMITVTIIGMLAAMLLFGLLKVQSQTQIARTKSTIAKIHSLVLELHDSYGTRRLPVNTINMPPKDAAELRLVALRQLQRLEMPDHWSEVTNAPGELKKIAGPSFSPTHFLGEPQAGTAPPANWRPALTEAYLRYYNTVGVNKPGAVPANSATGKPSVQQQDAECLYMILTVGATDERNGRELFLDSEVGDIDNDGAPEFLDAWGKPIRFIRWPVGFIDDPRQDSSGQARFGHLSDVQPIKAPASATAPLEACRPDALTYHDPFDVRRVDARAFLVRPLIYSGGPDKIVDIYGGAPNDVRDDPFDVDLGNAGVRDDATPCGAYDPLASFTVGTASVGLPKWPGIPHDLDVFWYQTQLPGNNKLNHYDNIHNQQMDASLK